MSKLMAEKATVVLVKNASRYRKPVKLLAQCDCVFEFWVLSGLILLHSFGCA